MFYAAEGDVNMFVLQALIGVLTKSVGGASKNFLSLALCLIS